MPAQGLTGRDLRYAILFAAAIYLAIRFITYIADILLIFSLSSLIAIVLDPGVSWLEKRKIPRQASAMALAIIILGLIAFAIYLIIPPATQQIKELYSQRNELAKNLKQWEQSLKDRYPSIAAYLSDPHVLNEDTIRRMSGQLLGGISRVTASLAGMITGAFLTFIITIYLLANPQPIVNGFLKAVGPSSREKWKMAGEQLAIQIRAWAQGIVIGMIAIFVFTWIGLLIIGVKQAFLFGVIAGLLEAVPILGPILSAIPPIIVALIQKPILALWVVILFIGIQQLESNVLVP